MPTLSIYISKSIGCSTQFCQFRGPSAFAMGAGVLPWGAAVNGISDGFDKLFCMCVNSLGGQSVAAG